MSDRAAEKQRISTAFLLSQVGGRSAQEFGKLLAPLNFTPPDAGILRLLGRSPGLSQQELARRLDMHASRLVAVIDSLENRGLVARVINVDDRRLYSLQITEAGREALSAIGRVARAHDDAICSGLTAAERVQLGELLQKLAIVQGLAPGIHPGYRTLGAKDVKKKSAPHEPGGEPANKDVPGCDEGWYKS
jgi:DNA-binding MarR family transcriptional regulator